MKQPVIVLLLTLGLLASFLTPRIGLATPNLNCYAQGGQAECTSPIPQPYNCTAAIPALVGSSPECSGVASTGCRDESDALAALSENYIAMFPQTCAGPTFGLYGQTITSTLGVKTRVADSYNTFFTDTTVNGCTSNGEYGCASGSCTNAYCQRQVACSPPLKPDATNSFCFQLPVCPTCNSGHPLGVGDPIQPAGGESTLAETDYQGTGDAPLSFVRYYSTTGVHTPAGTDRDATVLGILWHHTYQRSIVLESAVSPNLMIAYAVRPTGDFRYFVLSGTNWVPASDEPERLTATTNGSGQITAWQYTTDDDTVESYGPTGQLLTIMTRSGRVQTLTYSTASTPPSIAPVPGLLIQITDDSGRYLQLIYNSNSSLSQMIDPSGNVYGYRYDSWGDLAYVDYPTSGTRQYLNNESAYAPSSIVTQGLVTGIIDENSNRYGTYEYEAYAGINGIAYASWHGASADKFSLTFSFAAGYASSAVVTDPLGNVTTHNFVAANGHVKDAGVKRCTVTGCAKFVTTAITYDSAGYLQSKTDFNGTKTTYVYDDTRGLETQRVDASTKTSQRTINTTWDPTFHVPAQRTVLNASSVTETMSKWTYNTRGQVLSRCEIDPAVSGATSYVCGSATNAPTGVRQWVNTYCEHAGITAGTCPLLGLVLTVDGPRTDVTDSTTYLYYQTTDTSGCSTLGGTCHTLGDVQSVTNALGQVTTYVSYDTRGHVTRIKDANGTYTDMTYHPRGWLLTRTVRANADGSASSNDATTTIAYDNVGNVKQTTQPDGDYVSFTYDTAHRLTDVQDNLTNHIHYTLDAAGNRTLEQTYDSTSTLKRALTRQYDQLNQLTAQLNAATNPVQSFTNPAEAPPTGITYTDGYDGNGNAIYSVDGTTNHVGTEQQYDPLNRLIKTLQDHAGTGATHNTTTQYAYDTRDNLRSVVDPDSLTTYYTYDGLNNLTGLASPDTGSTAYTYDAAGNRLTQTDARSVLTSYGYDALNRLTTITYPTTSLNVTYSYDQSNATTGCSTSYPTGRLTTITDNSGSTTYCYDRRSNVLTKTQVTSGITLLTSYTYTNGDRVATISYPSTAIVTYTRNSNGQITGIVYKGSPTGTPVTLVSSVTYLPFGPLNVLTFGNGRTLTKTYDQDYAIDKVVSSVSSGLVIDATVDVLGNLTNASSTVGASPPTQQYQYDPLYRLTNVQDGSGNSLLAFTYEATGDRTSKTPQGSGTQTYGYAPTTHHLTSVAGVTRSVDANGNTTSLNGMTLTNDNRNRLTAAGTETYNYNGKGERVSKSSPVTLFVYAENGMLIGEYSNTGAVQREYIPMDGALVGAAIGTSLYYIETDQLGTPRQVIQPGSVPANDVTVWKWDYFANSSSLGENAPSVQTITFNTRFPGQYFDSETGLNYNYFRDYEPGTGRYVESDPIGLVGGINTYAYVRSNPLSRLDPVGLLDESSCCRSPEALKYYADNKAGGTVMCCGGNKVPCTAPSFDGNSKGISILRRCALAHEMRHVPDQFCPNCSTEAAKILKSDKKNSECDAHSLELFCVLTAFDECGNDTSCQDALLRRVGQSLNSKVRFCTEL